MEELMTTVRFAIELIEDMESELRIANEELHEVMAKVMASENATELGQEMPYGMDVTWELSETLGKLEETQNWFNRLLKG